VDPLRLALDTYEPFDAAESNDLARTRAALDAGDPWSRDQPLHLTASALVVDPSRPRVLLRWHARMGCWLQVGGHGDPGETDPWAIALREAVEETGLTDLRALTPAPDRRPVQVVVVPVRAGRGEPAHEHADIRYLLATAHPDAIRAETPDAAVRWFTFAEARAEVTEANLLDFLDRGEAALTLRS
jgi:8-oxo-dGTP pyrophosphatase MutT (NUDIX family)